MNREIIKLISDKKDQRLDVLEELIQNINNYTGEMLGIIEEIKYLDFIKEDFYKIFHAQK